MQFANSLVIGFGQGFQPVCGFNYGAKKYARVREGFWFCVRYGTIFLVLVMIAGEIFASQVIALFRADDAEVIRIGALALRLQCVTLPLFAYIMISSMMMQTTAQTAQASILALGRQGLFFLPAILIFPRLWALFGLQIAQPISDICTFVLTAVLQSAALRRMREKENAEAALNA